MMENGTLSGRGKYVRKLGVLDVCSIAETESWLNAMGAEGLRLKKFRSLWVTFEKSEVVPVLYRIVAVEERRYKRKPEATHQPGWNYVDQKGTLAIYAWYGDGEPTWDHDVFRNELKWVEEIEKMYFGTGVSVPLVMLALGFVIWKDNIQNPPTLLRIIDRSQDTMLWFIFCYLGIIITSFLNYVAARRWNKRLVDKGTITTLASQKPWKKSFKSKVFRSYLLNLLILSVVGLAIFNTGIFNRSALNQAEGLPIVRLMTVEKDSRMKPVYSPSDGKILGNDLQYRFSFLAPVQYKTFEWAQIPEKPLFEGDNNYRPIMNNDYYWMTFPDMGEAIVDEWVKSLSVHGDGESFVRVKHKAFDRLLVRESQNSLQLIGRKGHAVLFISYGGRAASKDLIEAAAKALGSK